MVADLANLIFPELSLGTTFRNMFPAPPERTHPGWTVAGQTSTILAITRCMGTDCSEDILGRVEFGVREGFRVLRSRDSGLGSWKESGGKEHRVSHTYVMRGI